MAFKQDRNDELMDALRAEVQFRYEPQFAWKSAVSQFLTLPALRAFWPMSAVLYQNPQALDMAPAAYHLTNNNVSLFGYDNLAPYVEFDGVDQYLSRADGGAANWADITGTELYIEPKQGGLMIGGWFWADSLAADASIIGKYNTVGNQRAYEIRVLNTGALLCTVSVDGAALTSVTSTNSISTGEWFFAVLRFDPSTEVATFLNNTKTTNVAAIPASIFDSTASFIVGARNNGVAALFNGRASMCFLCAAALSDAIVGQAFQQSRAMYGV